MRRSRPTRLLHHAAFISLIAASSAGIAACGDDKDCTTNADCPSGRICRLGLCALDPNMGDGVADGEVLSDVPLNCEPAVNGELVLNEILADPPAGADIDGNGIPSATEDEFVEIVNVGTREVALSNVEIDVNGKRIAAGHLCLGPNSARVVFGSGGLPSLTNTSGSVSLVIDGTVVQNHTYGSEGGRDSSLTLARQLDPTSDWVLHEDVWGAPYSAGTCANGNAFPDCEGGVVEPDAEVGDGGGEVVVDCTQAPIAGDLVVNEIMADPGSGASGNDANGDGVVDSTGDEFVEIVNVAGATLLFSGVTFHDGGTKTYALPTFCLEPDQALVLFGDYKGTGSFPGVITLSGGGLSLNNGGDSVILRDGGGAELARVDYGGEADGDQAIVRQVDLDPTAPFVRHAQAPNAGGRKMSPGTCQNGNAFPECATAPETETEVEVVEVVEADVEGGETIEEVSEVVDTSEVEIHDTDGPEDVGPSCGPAPAAGELVLNEVLFDPPSDYDANGDGTASTTQDEFIELINASGGALNLQGLQIGDAQSATRYTVGAVCLQPGEALVVFGKGAKVATAGGLIVVDDATHALNLNNDGDTVRVTGVGGAVLIDQLFQPVPADQSTTRSPDLTGAFANHKDVGGGAVASPGACINGAPLPACLAP